MTGYTIEVVPGMGYWTCPGCDQCWLWEDAYTCRHCASTWAECPNEFCYGDGADCSICHGEHFGLVRVETRPPAPAEGNSAPAGAVAFPTTVSVPAGPRWGG